MKRKSYVLTAVLMLCVLVLSACSTNQIQDENKTDGTTAAKEKVSIVLDWTPNTNHTGLFVAQAKGYFEEQGLEVEIAQPPEGGAEMLVGGGGAEFGISFQDTLAPNFASDNQLPVTAVATLIQHNTSGIISLKDKGIDSPAKMAGHSYATWDMPIEQAIIRKIVEDDGGKFGDIKMIPSTVTDVVTALQTDVDSVWVFYAWDGIATNVKKLETNYLNFADYGSELDYYSPVLIVNNDYAKNNPDNVKKVLKAIQQGYEFAIENSDEAAEILLEAAPELDPELVKASQAWLADQYKAEVKQWGYIDQSRWDAFYGWLYANKLIENEIPKGTGFTN
ncbi:MAG: ABC transporter substrate-binding protein, partial [Sedimentibacter sp.]|uniref:ABC transporter substrate-binding protein n=1 Tax=Sedimentibacter sp. TaxID=1960295 RepID=UPI0029820B99